jgi:hypothetical protein
MYGVEYWQAQAGMMRQQANRLRERAANPLETDRNKELLALASYCEEAAESMEDFTPSDWRGDPI